MIVKPADLFPLDFLRERARVIYNTYLLIHGSGVSLFSSIGRENNFFPGFFRRTTTGAFRSLNIFSIRRS